MHHCKKLIISIQLKKLQYIRVVLEFKALTAKLCTSGWDCFLFSEHKAEKSCANIRNIAALPSNTNEHEGQVSVDYYESHPATFAAEFPLPFAVVGHTGIQDACFR